MAKLIVCRCICVRFFSCLVLSLVYFTTHLQSDLFYFISVSDFCLSQGLIQLLRECGLFMGCSVVVASDNRAINGLKTKSMINELLLYLGEYSKGQFISNAYHFPVPRCSPPFPKFMFVTENRNTFWFMSLVSTVVLYLVRNLELVPTEHKIGAN